MNDNSQVLKFTVAVARKAGDILMSYVGTNLTRTIKKHKDDFVTEADHASERFIIGAISNEFPDDTIVAEESGLHERESATHTWIVDPLDGTFNFANGTDNFGVLICRTNGAEIDVAVAYNPKQNTIATSVSGWGATLDGKQVRLKAYRPDNRPITANRDLHGALRPVGRSWTDKSAIGGLLKALRGEYKANVANRGLIWDSAPAALMLAEAGWKVTDFAGNPFRWDGKIASGYPGIIAAPDDLHQELVNILKK